MLNKIFLIFKFGLKLLILDDPQINVHIFLYKPLNKVRKEAFDFF
jgi:hypothetical protein